MAVSVNLREVFPSDSQSNLTEKLNFNFNQLLLLGLGLKGDKGDTGDTGPIGPVGLTGAAGQRGSIVYSVQNTSTPNDSANSGLVANSINGDMFISSTKLYVKGAVVSGTWDQVVDFAAIVNSQSLQDPYKVLQLGLGAGTTASKHSKLLRTNGVDSNNTNLASTHPQYYTGAQPDNTQVVLTNFDESKTYSIVNGSLSSNSLSDDQTFSYTALQKIVAFLPSTFANYRHQLELSSVDGTQVTVGGSSEYYVITPTEQNLKFRKYRVSSNTLTGGLYNRADLDLSGSAASANSMNSEVAISINKRDTGGVSTIEAGVSNSAILGVRYPAAGLNLDGIYMVKGSFQAGIGIKADDATTLFVKSTATNVRVNNLNFGATNSSGITIGHVTPASNWVSLGGAIRVQNSKVTTGIPFPATPVSITDPNTLDDYAEASWTPTVNLSSAIPTGTHFSSSGWTTTSASGTYTKIGRAVFYTFKILVQATSSATSYSNMVLGLSASAFNAGSESPQMRIYGLPAMAPSNEDDNRCSIDLYPISASDPTLRETDITSTISSTQYTMYSVAPKTLFGRARCIQTGFGANPTYTLGIPLYAHRYTSTGRVDSVPSKLTPYDFLQINDDTVSIMIVGSGYYFTDGSPCGALSASPNGGQGLGGL